MKYFFKEIGNNRKNRFPGKETVNGVRTHQSQQEKYRLNKERKTEEIIKPSLQDLQQIERKMKGRRRERKIERNRGIKKGIELNEQDIRMLYAGTLNPKNIPDSEQGRKLMKELLQKRSPEKRRDFARIFNIAEDRISLTKKEALSGNAVYHYGSLNLSGITSAEGLKLPGTVNGSLILNGLKTAEGLKLPNTVNGDLKLDGLKTVEGLEFPKTVNGNLYLDGLETVKDLRLPETVNGSLILNGLKTAEGLKLPDTVNGDLKIGGLKTAEGLEFPKTVNGDLYLDGLETAKGLKLPDTIGGDLNLANLKTAATPKIAEGLKFPDIVGGCLVLSDLRTAEAVKFPKTVGALLLQNLTTLNGIKRWPSHINRELYVSEKLSQKDKAFLENTYPDKVKY